MTWHLVIFDVSGSFSWVYNMCLQDNLQQIQQKCLSVVVFNFLWYMGNNSMLCSPTKILTFSQKKYGLDKLDMTRYLVIYDI
jgi:hypothetical protein